ncbi:beta-glycosyltransferase [Jeotgalibacillus malaysiensis]|uniref:Beta-glycosyltransferase n=1 Tax=Jeotgalibacillus malaysiensis TaxID=1508404 RepID=A0A0B5AR51_9BACL|nr:glycosyltransferase family 2 protein [Jeotgalibacillus malaysiensis]AJD92715.1 beta-glycosyltransferase [Jeotgalibacillus malaysiensis]
MKTLTVFTPTYNRAYCLERVYLSLKDQQNKDFIWLIIDDGSTDHTAELVDSWKEEDKVLINYFYQENQGMHGAHNTAYRLMKTELNVCIDSDDEMGEDAVEKIISFWKRYGGNHVSGIIGLDAFRDGSIIGTELPQHVKTSTLFDLYSKHKVRGDKKLVYRTELTLQYPYPLFEGEKYVGLAYKYYCLDQQYPLLIMNEILCKVEYLEDGSTSNMYKQYMKNPKGFAFYRKELMKLPSGNVFFKFRQAIHYVSSSLISNDKQFLKETPRKAMTWMALPFGYLLTVYLKKKTAHLN